MLTVCFGRLSFAATELAGTTGSFCFIIYELLVREMLYYYLTLWPQYIIY